jgi:hypothetical protein
VTKRASTAGIVSAALLLMGGQQAGSGAATSLCARLGLQDATFESGTDVEVRLTLENRGRPCLPIAIDPSLFPSASPHRPHTVVTFAVTDEDGRQVASSDRATSTPGGLRPADVLVLDCNGIYGWYIHLVGGEWDYPLKKGSYRIRARVSSALGTFVRDRPDFIREFQRETRLPMDALSSFFRDVTVESEEVVLEVRRKGCALRPCRWRVHCRVQRRPPCRARSAGMEARPTSRRLS